MHFDLLFFPLAALKSLAVAEAMPAFFALRAKKIPASTLHKSCLGELYTNCTATQDIANHFSIEKLPAIVFTVSATPRSL
jgi:hypothetical protein